MKRRQVIQALLGTPALTAIPLPAQSPQGEIPTLTVTPTDAVGDAVARYFTPSEFAALRKLGDLIIPSASGRPGARDAKAPEFLDFLIAQSPAENQSLYRNGLDRLQSESRRRYNTPFEELNAQQADAILAPMHEPWTYASPADPLAHFLRQVKDDLLTATFNSREYAEAQAAAGRRGTGMGTYWLPIE